MISPKSLRTSFALVLLFAAPSLSVGQSTETLRLFDEGNLRYEAGEYSKAASAYEAAAATGHRSAALHYNLGNAYYRLDEIGKAILNYERALLLDPDSRAVRHSIDLARTRTMDRISQLPEPIWTTTWRRVVAVVGLSGILWVGMLLYLAGASFVIWRIVSGRKEAWLRRVATVLIGIGVPLVAMSLFASRADKVLPRCVVVDRAVALRLGPDENADVDVEIHEGLVVHTIDSDSSWFRVRLPNGVVGWVKSSSVEPI
jgi:hypothetical protein